MLKRVAEKEIEASHQPVQQFLMTGTAGRTRSFADHIIHHSSSLAFTASSNPFVKNY